MKLVSTQKKIFDFTKIMNFGYVKRLRRNIQKECVKNSLVFHSKQLKHKIRFYQLLVFITAEIGVNWDGDFILIEKMMRDAKNSGCDAVKLQAFNEKIISEHPQKNRLLKSSVSKNNIEQIDSISKKIGIEWYCTPMYPDAIDFLDPFVKRYKIRYSRIVKLEWMLRYHTLISKLGCRRY